MQGSQLKLFKVFRLLRILRPLPNDLKNEGLRVAIQAMLYAIPNIINVTVISALFFLIFGIIGVNYFKGRFFSCKKMTDLEEHNKWECLDTGGIWENGVYHFDNIVSAMMTLFHMSTTAGWEIVMYRGAARQGVDEELVRKSAPGWYIFFIAFMIIGSFFILNLFVGIVISTFNREKDNLGRSFLLSNGQKEWVTAQHFIFSKKPKKVLKEHSSWIRA